MISFLFVVIATVLSFATSQPLSEGTNIDGIADYSSTLAFVDVTKQSRAWGSLSSPWDSNCSVDASGWPNQTDFGNVFVTLLGDITDTHTPLVTGDWLIQFTGQATVIPHPVMGPNVYISNVSYNAASDTTTATLNITNTTIRNCNCIMLGFANASTVNYGPGLRNIRVLQPNYTMDQVNNFSTPLLNLLSRFSLFRFMDWAKTNGNMISEWNQRTLPSSYSYAGSYEVPWEVIFTLANTLQKDAWINIPINASDDYILQLALLTKQYVNPNLHVYVEYSNEVWNFGFSQYRVNLEAANYSVYNGDPYHFNASNLPGNNNPGYWIIYRYVWFTNKIATIFKSVFGNDNVGKDKFIRPVFCWQEGGGESQELGFLYLETQLNMYPSELLHSICLAPYITIGDAAENDPDLTVDEVIEGWQSYAANISIAGPYDVGGPNYLASFAATCTYYGIYCQAYESGPDTVQGIDAGGPLYAKANASIDPRITPIITNYIRDWHSYGQQMYPMNYFTAGAGPLQDKYGIYSILYNMNIMDSPKLDGINYAIFNGSVPISSKIPTIPVNLNASYFTGHPYPPTCDGFDHWPAMLNYLVQSNEIQNISITVTAASEYPGNVTLQVSISNEIPDIRNITCISSGNWYNYTNCFPAQTFMIGEGVSTIRVVRPSQYPPWIGEILINTV